MKKLLLTLGSVAAISAPVAAVVACSNAKPHEGVAPSTVTPTDVLQTEITEKATVTMPKTSEPVDDGFNAAPLIKDFDINNEKGAVKTYSYNGKDFSDVNSALQEWIKDANGANGPTEAFIKDGLTGLVAKAEFKNNKFIFDFIQNGKPYKGGHYEYNSIEQLMASYSTIWSKPAPIEWIDTHQIKVSYKNEHSIDSIIYSQAQSLKDTIKTDHDRAYVGKFSGSYTRDNKDLDLLPYAKWAPFGSLVAEYRPGDSIVFAFDNENDLASFTQRVRYDNTSDYDNNMPIAKVEEKSIKYQPVSIKDGEIMAANVNDYSVGKNISIFKLNVIARNAVELTFNDFFNPITHNPHIDAQLLYLNGFKDANNDGIVDVKDLNMVGSFMVDKGAMYSNYASTKYIKKDTFVAGYDEAKKVIGL